MLIFDLILIFISGALSVIASTTILNVFTFPRLQRHNHADTQNRVSTFVPHPHLTVCIPARNESAVIVDTLRSLLSQDYPAFDVILLDDNSTDDTGKLARSLNDSRLTVLNGQPLPHGWMGKNWACHQMAQIAAGDYLIFTDADVRWSQGGLAALVHELQRTHADLLTIWPTQTTVTWTERLTVPLMALAVVGYLPILAVHHLPLSIFAAACGQCLVWRREAYQRIGGHARVANNVLEDVTMARLVKQAGLRLRMADGAGVIGCRMYTDWHSVRNGYAKNILAGYGNSIPFLLIGTVFHWVLFIFPPVWLLTGWLSNPHLSNWLVWSAALTTLGIGVRMLTAAFSRQRLQDALLMPLSALLMTRIAFQSIYWQLRYGGPQWKGRIISKPKSPVSQSPLDPKPLLKDET